MIMATSKLIDGLRAVWRRISAADWSFAKTALGAAALLALAVFLAAGWLGERRARVTLSRELEEFHRRAAAETRELEARAEAAVRQAETQHAQALGTLQTRRRALEREAQSLRARLSALELEPRARAEAVSTLDSDELTRRLATRPGPGAAPAAATKEVPHSTFKIQDLPRAAEEIQDSRLQIQDAIRATEEFQDSRLQIQDVVRAAELAFTGLEGCRERASLGERLLANCEERVRAERAAVAMLDRSAAEWREAARLKDELAARRASEHQRALRAARGSRWRRFTRALQYVAIGVVVGVAVR
jgi:hypothetical protein